MKFLGLLVFLVGMFAYRPAEAIVDPDPNTLGLYFDQKADLGLTNPTFSSILGIECQLDWDESLATYLAAQPIILEVAWLGDPHAVVMGSPTQYRRPPRRFS